MTNVASVLNANKHKRDLKDILEEKEEEKRQEEKALIKKVQESENSKDKEKN